MLEPIWFIIAMDDYQKSIDEALIERGLLVRDDRPLPPTHPDQGPMELVPRQEDGRISAYYYCSKEELAACGSDGPPPRRHRHDGWTVARQKEFLELLAATASVSDAARGVGMSRTSAYRLYNRADAGAFRAAWDQALAAARNVLATTAFDRAVNGAEEIVYYKGQRIGVRWKFNDRLLMFLLRVRDPLNYAPLDDLQGWLRHRDVEPHRPIEPALERLVKAEEAWGRRIEGESADPAPPSLPGPAPNE
jgi:hypothetical protein